MTFGEGFYSIGLCALPWLSTPASRLGRNDSITREQEGVRVTDIPD